MSARYSRTSTYEMPSARRRLVLGAAVLLVLAMLAAAVLLVIARRQSHGQPTLPRVGATFVYRMMVDLDNDILTPRLRVRCVKAVGRQRTLEVSYLTKDGQWINVPWKGWPRSAVSYPAKYGRWKPAYLVLIRYGINDVSKRTVVQDLAGKVIRRGQTVLGVPVPFHNLLFFPGDKLPEGRTPKPLSDGWTVKNMNKDDSFAPTDVPSLIQFSLYKDHQHKAPIGYYLENQEWYVGEWLWRKVVRESDTPGDPRFELIRIDSPK